MKSPPRIGLGTWQLEGDACVDAVMTALELGYRHIDTAQGYENETEVGLALDTSALAREDIFITTKVWPDHLSEDPRIVEESLDRLRVEAVDLLLLHWPSPTRPLEEAVEALGRVQESGLAHAIGVSNYTPRLLERARKVVPEIAVNQVEMHPYLQQAALRSACDGAGVEIVAYSPLARGEVMRDRELARIGRAAGFSPAQVALAWLFTLGVGAVPKASSRDHLAANLEAPTAALDPDELAAIAALDRGRRLINPEFAPAWGP